MIKAVIFDLDDTLYDFETAHRRAYDKLCREAADRLGVSPGEFARVYDESYDALGKRMGMEYETGTMHSRVLRLQYALEKLGKPLFPHVLELYDLYWNEIIGSAEPEPGIVQVMQLLREKHIAIGLGTNMTAHVQYRKLQKMGLGQYFNFIVTSDEPNCDKPGERFYRLCVEKSGCKAEECLFVGDNYDLDYVGPRAFGMQAMWYNRVGKTEHADCPHMLKSHFDLIPVLEHYGEN